MHLCLRCSPGQGNTCWCAVTLYVGEGLRGNNGACSTLPVFSHFLCSPLANWPFWCCFPSGWFCVHSRPLWVSPTNSPVRLGVSPAAASTPTGVSSQWFEASFPHVGALGCAVCYPAHQLLPRWPAAALPTHSTIRHLAGSISHHITSSPLLPGCLSPPLLPVWMNVSSLTP